MANGMDFLQDVITDPSNREGVMESVNTGIAGHYKTTQKRVQKIDEAQRLLSDISQDTERQKQQFQVETAEQVDAATSDMDQLLESRARDFQTVQENFSSVTNEMTELHQQARSRDIPYEERKKAAKRYNELNQDALRLHQLRQATSQGIKSIAQNRNTVAKNIQHSRTVEQQKNFDVGAFTEAFRLEQLTKRLETRHTMETQNTQILAQMRTLSAGEAKEDEMLNNDTLKSFNTILNGFSESDNYNREERQRSLARFQQLSEQERVALNPVMATIERARQEGEELSSADIKGLIVKEGRIDSLRAAADISGDTQLQEVVTEGFNSWVNGTTAEKVEQWKKDNDTSQEPQGEAMQAIQEEVQNESQGLYARDIVDAYQANTSAQVSAEVSAAGSDIFATESDEPVVNVEDYSPKVQEVINSEEFKQAQRNPDMSIGDSLLGAVSNMMEVFESKGFSSDNDRAEAARAVADVTGSSAKRWLRDKDSPAMEAVDHLGSIGRPTTNGMLRKKLPAYTRRYERFMDDSVKQRLNQTYDQSSAADIMAQLEVFRAVRKGRQRGEQLLRQGRDDQGGPMTYRPY